MAVVNPHQATHPSSNSGGSGNSGGGVDTGDHDGDEQYGSDRGAPASTPNSLANTAPSDTGGSDTVGTTTQPGDETSDVGSSGGGESGGGGSSGDTGVSSGNPPGAGGPAGGIPNSQINSLPQGEHLINGHTVHVSVDSNGNRHVRVPYIDKWGRPDSNRFLLRITRPDGTINDQHWDTDRSRPVSDESNYTAAAVAGGLVPFVGSPELSMITRQNADTMIERDIDHFNDQWQQHSGSPDTGADKLDALAEEARLTAAKWRNSGYSGDFRDNGGNAVDAEQYFNDLADRMSKHAANIRQGVETAADGDPSTRELTEDNAWYVLDADKAFLFKNTRSLPNDVSERAETLSELANTARKAAEKWEASGLGATFVGADGQRVTAAEYFRVWAEDLQTAATENREIAQQNASLQQAHNSAVEEAGKQFTEGVSGVPNAEGAPEIEGSAGPFQDRLVTLQDQSAYAKGQVDLWQGTPADELITIPGEGSPGHEEQTSPSTYWARQVEFFKAQESDVQGQQAEHTAFLKDLKLANLQGQRTDYAEAGEVEGVAGHDNLIEAYKLLGADHPQYAEWVNAQLGTLQTDRSNALGVLAEIRAQKLQADALFADFRAGVDRANAQAERTDYNEAGEVGGVAGYDNVIDAYKELAADARFQDVPLENGTSGTDWLHQQISGLENERTNALEDIGRQRVAWAAAREAAEKAADRAAVFNSMTATPQSVADPRSTLVIDQADPTEVQLRADVAAATHFQERGEANHRLIRYLNDKYPDRRREVIGDAGHAIRKYGFDIPLDFISRIGLSSTDPAMLAAWEADASARTGNPAKVSVSDRFAGDATLGTIPMSYVDLVPFVGTATYAAAAARDGYTRGELASIGTSALFDFVPAPVIAKAPIAVVRGVPRVAPFALGQRWSRAAIMHGTGKAPLTVAGTRTGPKGISNIPISQAEDLLLDVPGQSTAKVIPGWEGLLRQRDLALGESLRTGQRVDVPMTTVSGATQTVVHAPPRLAQELGGAAMHTSPSAGFLAELSQSPGGLVSKFKYRNDGVTLLPDLEQNFFFGGRAAPLFLDRTAFRAPVEHFDPGVLVLADPRNLRNVGGIRKVFGADLDAGIIPESSVVEAEGVIGAGRRAAGGEDGAQPPIYRERPIGWERISNPNTGEKVLPHVFMDSPSPSNLRVIRANLRAEIDRLRGNTDDFYLVRKDPTTGQTTEIRRADLDALTKEGDDAIAVLDPSTGETRYVTQEEARRLSHTFGGRLQILTVGQFNAKTGRLLNHPLRAGLNAPGVKDSDDGDRTQTGSPRASLTDLSGVDPVQAFRASVMTNTAISMEDASRAQRTPDPEAKPAPGLQTSTTAETNPGALGEPKERALTPNYSIALPQPIAHSKAASQMALLGSPVAEASQETLHDPRLNSLVPDSTKGIKPLSVPRTTTALSGHPGNPENTLGYPTTPRIVPELNAPPLGTPDFSRPAWESTDPGPPDAPNIVPRIPDPPTPQSNTPRVPPGALDTPHQPANPRLRNQEVRFEEVVDAEGNPLYPEEVQWVSHSLNTANFVTGERQSRPLSNTNLRTFKVTRRGPEKLGGQDLRGENLDIVHQGGVVSAKQVPERKHPAVFRRDDAPPVSAQSDEFAYLDQPRSIPGRRGRRRRGRRHEDELPTNDVGELTITVNELL